MQAMNACDAHDPSIVGDSMLGLVFRSVIISVCVLLGEREAQTRHVTRDYGPRGESDSELV